LPILTGGQKKTDSQGNKWTYYFNDVGIIERVIDPLGNETNRQLNKVTAQSVDWEDDLNGNRTRYTYDGDGNIASKTDPLGNTWTYTWTYTYGAVANLLETETDPLGVVTKYEYDAYGNQTKLIREFGGALGNTTTYIYDSQGKQISITDPLGNTTTYQYNSNGNLIRVTDPLGNVTSYTYDSRANKLTETDALGNTTVYTYDLMDHLLSVTDALGNTTTFAYDSNGNRMSETDASGNITTFIYDAYDRLVRQTDPLGNTISYSYDSRDNLISKTDPNGNTTTHTYDILDRLTRETDALGGQTTYAYDAEGNLLTETDANGNTITFGYDAVNRLISESNPLSETTTYTYNAVGKRLTQNLANGNVVSCTYDTLNRLVSISDLIGIIKNRNYDVIGRLISEEDANGNVTTYQYDELGRVVKEIDPMGGITTYNYDNLGNLLAAIDREGNTTSYNYNAINRQISMTDALSNTTSYQYDDVGNMIRITDANGNVTRYEYDNANRKIREVYADDTTREFTYDGTDNLLTYQDQNGNTTGYVYDAVNYLTKRDYPDDNDDLFTYDSARRMLSASNLVSALAFSYDNAGRMSRITENGQNIDYSYDIPNNKRIITYPGGKVVTETFDMRNRLVGVNDAGKGDIAIFSYDSAVRVLSKGFLNGTVTTYNYNKNSLVTNLTHTKDSTLIVGFGYDFDKEGNRKYCESLLRPSTNSERYEYDGNYRLTGYKTGQLTNGDIPAPIKTRTWNFDTVGNWTQFTIDGTAYKNTPNQVNEYDDLSNNGSQFVPDDDGVPDDFNDAVATPGADGFNSAHDKNGNLIDDGINTYEYDFENRLIRVARKSDNAVMSEYGYDAFGRQFKRIASGITLIYLHDGARTIQEQIGGAIEAEYVYGNTIDEILTMDRNGQMYFYHCNSLGSIIALTDESGNAAETYDYDAYGHVTIMDSIGTVLESSGVGNTYLFTGRKLENLTGLYYYRARYYHPGRGRFIQRDPLGYFDGMNLYEYVISNPINFADPTGNATTPDGVDLGPTDKDYICCITAFSVTKKKGSDTTTGVRGNHIVRYSANDGKVKNNKCCKSDCCLYRQHVKGYWRNRKGGGKRYTLESCGNIINMQNWVEEYTSCIRGGTKNNRIYSDWPGWGSGLSNGKYVEMHFELKYRVWDTCQGKWEGSSDTGTLEIAGDKVPRFISYN